MNHLMHHKDDFQLAAEWHYHATAHGKGPCDGLGAILKSEATRYSLQANPNDAITNSASLFKWAKNKFKNIIFFTILKKITSRLLAA